MIEVIASGPVKRRDDQKVDKRSGHDDIYGRVTTVREVTVEIDLEFPQGYVNLEGYAPSGYESLDPLGSISAYVGGDPVAEEWSVALRGEWFDWVQQAHRYLTERPDKSLVGCLRLFRRWDETPSDTIEKAEEMAKHATRLATMKMGDFGDDGFAQLTRELNTLDHVQIPESYSE